MRIRKPLNWIAAAAIVGAVAVPVSGYCQANPEAASASTSETRPALFDWAPGRQIGYQTKATLKISGGTEREEKAQVTSRFTALDKSDGKLTVLVEVNQADVFSTGVANERSGPRFTVEVPVTGADPLDQLKKAGLASSPVPGWDVENFFASVPEKASTTTLIMPVTDEPMDVPMTVEKGAMTTVKYALNSVDPKKPSLSRTLVYDSADKSYKSVATSVSLSVDNEGNSFHFNINLDTQRTTESTLDKGALDLLKKDVADGVAVANKLRSGINSPEAVKSVVDDMDKYLSAHANGIFAEFYLEGRNSLKQRVEIWSNSEKIKEGAEAPDFTAQSITTQTVKLSSYKGKVVMLDFWATWCGPCVQLVPETKTLYDKYKDKGFTVIGISADRERADLEGFIKERKMEWPQIFEGEPTSGTIMYQYGVMKFPTIVLIDKKGVIRAVDVVGDELDKDVAALLEGKDLPPAPKHQDSDADNPLNALPSQD